MGATKEKWSEKCENMKFNSEENPFSIFLTYRKLWSLIMQIWPECLVILSNILKGSPTHPLWWISYCGKINIVDIIIV